MNKILIVEDNRKLATEIQAYLADQRCLADIASCAQDAMARIRENSYDVCLLDVGLPDCNGFELCQKIRNSYTTPIIMLTAFDSEDNIVYGLQCGADDYVTKPFSLRVLMSRISSQLRRQEWSERSDSVVLLSGDIQIDLLHHMIYKGEIAIAAGETEFLLCSALANSNGRIMPRGLLLELVWDYKEDFVENNTLSVLVSRLRKKLGSYGDTPYIDTVKGIGYRWNVEVRRGPHATAK